MENLGISVGEWSDNQYANFGSSQQRTLMAGIVGFLPSFSTSIRNRGEYGDAREIRSRKESAKVLLDKGFSKDDIARLWSNYKLDVQTKFDKDKFLAYADRKRIIDKARKEEEDRLYEQGKAEEEQQIINDSNLFLTNEEPTENITPTTSVPTKKSNTNLYIYGGIGLVVIVGAFLIFKK